MQLRLTLPELPPSVNALYKNLRRGGRAKTKRYSEWIKLCLYVLKPTSSPIQSQVRVCYTFVRPDKRIRDVANLEKATSDILVKAGILADDSQIVDLRIRWATEPQIEPVMIEITELTGAS